MHRDGEFLRQYWHPSCYFIINIISISHDTEKKDLGYKYDKRNIYAIICDTNIP